MSLTLQLADRAGVAWAQEQVTTFHYLRKPVDSRCSPLEQGRLFGQNRKGSELTDNQITLVENIILPESEQAVSIAQGDLVFRLVMDDLLFLDTMQLTPFVFGEKSRVSMPKGSVAFDQDIEVRQIEVICPIFNSFARIVPIPQLFKNSLNSPFKTISKTGLSNNPLCMVAAWDALPLKVILDGRSCHAEHLANLEDGQPLVGIQVFDFFAGQPITAVLVMAFPSTKLPVRLLWLNSECFTALSACQGYCFSEGNSVAFLAAIFCGASPCLNYSVLSIKRLSADFASIFGSLANPDKAAFFAAILPKTILNLAWLSRELLAANSAGNLDAVLGGSKLTRVRAEPSASSANYRRVDIKRLSAVFAGTLWHVSLLLIFMADRASRLSSLLLKAIQFIFSDQIIPAKLSGCNKPAKDISCHCLRLNAQNLGCLDCGEVRHTHSLLDNNCTLYTTIYQEEDIHTGTLYRAANFTLVRENVRGIQTYVRPVRRLTHAEKREIIRVSQTNERSRRYRALRAVAEIQQTALFA